MAFDEFYAGFSTRTRSIQLGLIDRTIKNLEQLLLQTLIKVLWTIPTGLKYEETLQGKKPTLEYKPRKVEEGIIRSLFEDVEVDYASRQAQITTLEYNYPDASWELISKVCGTPEAEKCIQNLKQTFKDLAQFMLDRKVAQSQVLARQIMVEVHLDSKMSEINNVMDTFVRS